MHELCYATSKNQTSGFTYGGVIVSNCDKHIGTYKPPEMAAYFPGNNHGGMAEIKGQWYIFYHRHTNGTNFSRQGCAEPISINADGSINQVEMTSCGLGCKPLEGRGVYPAYIVCNLFSKTEENTHPLHHESWIDGRFPKITQDGKDGDEESGYIANMRDSTIAGFKYFLFEDIRKITVKTRGYGKGHFEVKTSRDGDTFACIPIDYSNIWVENSIDVALPDGVSPLYFEFKGDGGKSFLSFVLE